MDEERGGGVACTWKNCMGRIMCIGMEYEDDDDLMRVC